MRILKKLSKKYTPLASALHSFCNVNISEPTLTHQCHLESIVPIQSF